LYVRRTDVLQAVLHDFEGQLWFVAVATKVAKVEMP
jgi:hypothetical protein